MVGGLGNQMFQYAIFKRFLEDKKEEVFYDTLQNKEHNGFELAKLFNITQAPITSLSQITGLKVQGETTYPRFNPDVLEYKNTYLEGNWQNVGYFPDADGLKKDFEFKVDLDPKNKLILKDIQESNSVSIHVRKTDYNKYIGYFFQADWMNYYGTAVSYIAKNEKVRPLKFFVFSDDIAWCKKNFMIDVNYVENKKEDAWKDMMLMSNCKHNITVNSTFSWWAAWLNKNPNKIVITPKRWFLDNTDSNNITLSEWIKL